MARSVLLNRPSPYEDEALASWLWRLAERNYLPSPTVLLRYLRDSLSDVTPIQRQLQHGLHDPALFTALAEVADVSVETVCRQTIHRFAHVLTPPDREVRYLQTSSGARLTLLSAVPSTDYFSPRFAWCPACLAECRYVRLHWYLPFLACCPVHRCWLLDNCPACQKKLKEADIVLGHCSGCNLQLEQAVSIPVPADDLLLTMTSTVMEWLYGRPRAPRVDLPEASTSALFRVMQGLRYSAQRAGDDWEFHHIPDGISTPSLDILERRSLTIFERGCLYATAFRGLLDWPNGFIAFLDALRRRPAEKEKTGLRREFGALYVSWLMRFWKHPAFDFIQAAFNDYLVERMPVYQIVDSTRVRGYPELLDRLDYLDLKRTVSYLNVSISSVHRLIKEKHLTVHRFEGDEDGQWLAREELDRLTQRWQKHMVWPQVVRLLGISLEVVQRLVESGLLRAVPASDGLKEQKTYIDENSVYALIQALRKHTTIQTDEDHAGMPLRTVCLRHASARMNSARVLKRVLAGKLPAYHPCESLFPLHALWFAVDDVAHLSATVKDEQNWFSKQEVRAYLGVSWLTVQQLIVAGFLKPRMSLGRKQFFCRDEVAAVRERCVFVGEMMRALRVPASCISRLVHQGALQPISTPMAGGPGCYIFDRADFVAWRREYILTPEIGTLTTNVKAVKRRLEAAGVEPIARFPNVYPRLETLSLIAQLTETRQRRS